MKTTIRLFGALACTALLAGASLTHAEDAYPSKPVTILHGLAIGGQTDVSVRMLADALSKHLDTPFIVNARPGAGQTIAASALANAAPDGYTIGHFYQGTFSTTPTLQKTPDHSANLTPIIAWQMSPQLLITRSDSPYRTLADLVASAKTPRGVDFGHAGMGSVTFLAPTIFAKVAGIHLNEIPYKGDSDLITALLGGYIPLASVTEVAAAPLIASGKVRALVTFAQKRSADFPDVPTFKDAGYDVPVHVPVGILFAPKGTPASVIGKLHDATKQVLDDPAMKAEFARLKQVLYYMDGEQVSTLIADERKTYLPILREAGAIK